MHRNTNLALKAADCSNSLLYYKEAMVRVYKELWHEEYIPKMQTLTIGLSYIKQGLS